ncbi:MAG: tRNA pseudouridine(55) synthase TruB, partial [Acidimicrobiales bacterium]
MTPSSGLLLIDKDAGATSHDAVAAVRRTLQVKRAGHAGTLDPMATGLLVVGLGGATRLLRFAQAGVKRYEGEALLGVATDSLDAQGAAVGRARVPDLDDATLAAAAAGFLGDIDHTPPMVSAVKVGGRRLYEIAREGREVERAARRVRVDSFDVSLVDTDRVRFAVTCSTGTYVRVLLAELAERLGTLGHLVALRRVASGSLRVEDAVSVARLAQLCADGAAPVRPAGDMV